MDQTMKDTAISLAFSFVITVVYCIGYVKGFNRGLKTDNGWQQMYDEHINRQWDLIQRRDSLYMQNIDLKLQ